jgi:hypothetical protein
MNPARWRRWALRHARLLTGLLVALWVLSVFAALTARWRALGLTGTLLLIVLLGLWSVWVRWQRERAVREAALPQFLKRKLRETYPHLSGKDCDLVERGLRQFFWACLRSQRKFVAMPSKVVDAMWHEFILHTHAYREWCDLTLGGFLHHTPAEALGAAAKGNDGLRRAWYWACRDESINPRQPTRLPLLFALDAKLEIAGGFRYQPDCRDISRKSDQGGDGSGGSYCGTDFSDGSHSGDADGLGGVDGSGDGGGDGGGCGGGGD